MKLPPISLGRAGRTYTKLSTKIIASRLYGRKFEGDVFKLVTQRLAELLSTANVKVSKETMRSTCSYLLGKEITAKNWDWLLRFIAANLSTIQRNVPAMPASAESPPAIWTCVQFIDLKQIKKDKKAKLEFELRVVNGLWFDHKVYRTVDVASPQIGLMLRRAGVTNLRQEFATPRDLIQLYLFVKLQLDSFSDKLTFYKCECSPYLLSRNKKLTSERRKPCIRGYQHPCYSCQVGYPECHRATRPVALTVEKEKLSDTSRESSGRNVSEGSTGQLLDVSPKGHCAQLHTLREESTGLFG